METNLERGRRLGRRYVLAAFMTLASTFVVLSSLEITREVFGPGFRLGPSLAAPLHLDATCSDDLRGLAAAVERAMAASGRESGEGRATARYREALLPEWGREDAVGARCAREPGGSDAVALVLRLRLTGEGLARRQAGELGPLRQDLAAYLGH